MKFLSTLVSTIFFLSINAVDPSTNEYGNSTNSLCIFPFYLVGDQCLFIDRDLRGTWTQSRDVCLALEGDLVSLSDANLLYDINNYIVANGMDGISYWIGASDRDFEGNWIWTVDDTPVRMMSPIWGGDHYDAVQPDGGNDQNCAVISNREFNFVHDEECNTTMYGFICQAKSEALKSTVPIPSNECPPPFERIGSGCYQFHLNETYSWHEARDLCSGTYTHLAKLDDANVIADIREYFIGKNKCLWVDGSDEIQEDQWVWFDGSPVKRGTPFWDVVNEGKEQLPSPSTDRNCVIFCWDRSYRHYDNYCEQLHTVACQYDM